MARFGFIGLGAMGAHMSSHLFDKVQDLAIFDARDEAMIALAGRGATTCSSPTEVANNAETVFVSLPTPDIVREVLTGAQGLLAGTTMKTFVDLSTTGPVVAGELAAALEHHGVQYLDAPVSGGPNGAEKGTLTVIASGDEALFDELEPFLSTFGTNVFYVGEAPGQGQLAKILNNLLSTTAVTITGEALALGVRGGLDPTRLLEVINVSSGRNTASADKYPRCVLPRSFDFGFKLQLMLKDIKLCLDEAARQHVPMVLGSTVQQLVSVAATNVDADADCTEIAKLFEAWADVTIGMPTTAS